MKAILFFLLFIFGFHFSQAAYKADIIVYKTYEHYRQKNFTHYFKIPILRVCVIFRAVQKSKNVAPFVSSRRVSKGKIDYREKRVYSKQHIHYRRQ